MWRLRFEYWIIFLVVLLDLASKFVVVSSGVRFITNTGISFSLISGPMWFWVGTLGAIIIVAMHIFCVKNLNLGFALVLGGGISNIVDRLIHGGVTDFIYVWYLPVFNFADVAIVSGVIYQLFTWTRRK